MKTMELKVARIGNSRGVRLPADTLRRYRIGNVALMEEREEGILLHSKDPADRKLSWDDTARAMAESQEDWGDWNGTAGDGLCIVPWQSRPGMVAEQRAPYGTKAGGRRRKRGSGGAA